MPTDFAKNSFADLSDDRRLALLNDQIDYAKRNSSYYRDALQQCTALSSLRGVRCLPFLTPQILSAQGTALCCVSASDISRIVTQQSSGTSGTMKRMYFSEEDLQSTVRFFREGMSRMTDRGNRVGIFLPGSAPNGLCDLLSRGLAAFGARPTVYGEILDASVTAQQVAASPPDVLVGMPWQIRALAIVMPLLRPKTVLLSADYIPNALKDFLHTVWNCKVLSHYGLTETGYGFAVQHPDSADMYYRRDAFLAEVVDPLSGEPLPCGQEGELVISSLRRVAMPLIRYRTGDRAIMTDDQKIARIPGRLGIADEFYQLQETLSVLPWLVDYLVRDGRLTAHITKEAPADCESVLAQLTGTTAPVLRCSTQLLLAGKRF